jgi:hypothetical protein
LSLSSLLPRCDPTFNDAAEFPLARTTALEAVLRGATLELAVFDDADLDMHEAGLLGLAAVPLAPLAEGLPLHGSFPLYNRRREVTGHVVVEVQVRRAG